MNKFLSCFLLFVILFLSLNSFKKLHLTHSLATDEQQIMALTINVTVPRDAIFRKIYTRENSYFKFDFDDYSTIQAKRDSMVSLSYHQHLRKLDTIRKVLDTAKIYVFLDDTINKVQRVDLKSMVRGLKSDIYKKRDKEGILKIWAREIKMTEFYVDFKNVKQNSLYHRYTYLLSSEGKQLPPKTIVAGKIIMSPILFNTKKSKAFVFSEFFHDFHYIPERYIFLEKRLDKWIIVKIMYDWGS